MIEFKKKIFNWLKAGSLACCCVIGCASQAEALSIDKLSLLNDIDDNSLIFWVQYNDDSTSQIFNAVKGPEDSAWGTPFLISDVNVNVTSEFQVIKDSLGNILVTWIGANSGFGVYCLYTNVYNATLNTWSGPALISDTAQNLTGSFSLNLDPAIPSIEVAWSTYDTNFNMEIFSRRLIIGQGWESIIQLSM